MRKAGMKTRLKVEGDRFSRLRIEKRLEALVRQCTQRAAGSWRNMAQIWILC